jgi:TolB-like protein/DNA-binding winged helix-turn-helix (wHTH) protein/Tfp pilus assembly protein PilF
VQGSNSQRIYEFGPFRLDAAEHLLLRDGAPVPLTPKSFDMLLALVGHSGHMMTKDELMNAVWPDAVVEESNLTVTVSALRRALGEDPSAHRYIETVPRRGYRFVADVRTVESDNVALIVKQRIRAQIVTEEEISAPDEAPLAQGGPQFDAEEVEETERPTAKRALTVVRSGSRGKNRRRLMLIASASLIAIAAALFAWSHFAGSGEAINSIAVLPFTNTTADPDAEYLSDGITESAINTLSKLPGLRVVPRSSVFRYKGRQIEPRQAARDLGVRAVLTGRIIQRGDTLSVQAELIDVERDAQLWGERYDRRLSDVLAVEQEIAREISDRLRLRLTGEERQRLNKRDTQNTDAYHAYLKGRYYWNQRNETGLKKGLEYFRQAVESDPSYAVAHSGLADSYTALGYFGNLSPQEAFPAAKASAMRALELDSTLAEPHTSLAYARLYYDWDWPEAEREFRRALEIDPNYATAHHWYSVYLTAMNRPDEAAAEIKRAQELDPLSLVINTDIGFELYYSRRHDEAIKQLRTTLEMNPKFPLAHLWLGRAYEEKGLYREALAEFKQVDATLPSWPVAIAAIGHVAGVAGQREEARQALNQLFSLSKQKYVTPYGVALVYAGLGEKEQAFEWLNKAYDERSHWLVWLKLDPRWDNLRPDPRFAKLVRRIGLTP